MDGKTLLIGGGLLIVGGYFFLKSRQNQSDTNKADNATGDLSDPTTQQALRLYNLLGVERGAITGQYGLKIFHDIDEDDVLNLLLSVTDWAGLQKKFKALTNNEYSLVKALSDGLTADEYNAAIKYASAKKVVTTTTAAVGINEDNVVKYRTVPANTIVGALISSGGTTYTFVNEYDDGEEITGFVYASQSKLV